MGQYSYTKVDIGQGVELAYIDAGEGLPLLLIHGFPGTAEAHLGRLIDEFSRDHRVIAPDLRGYGASRPPTRTFPPDFYRRDADDMAALLDKLQCGPAAVLGYSDGAETAVLLAASRPDLARCLAGWGVSGVISADMLTAVSSWQPVSAWGREREVWKQEIIARHGAEQLEPIITGWVEAARAIYASGGNICLNEAAGVLCPALLINGEGEIGNRPEDVSRLAAAMPQGRLIFVPNSGHAIQNDQPEELIRLIRGFLTELEVSLL